MTRPEKRRRARQEQLRRSKRRSRKRHKDREREMTYGLEQSAGVGEGAL